MHDHVACPVKLEKKKRGQKGSVPDIAYFGASALVFLKAHQRETLAFDCYRSFKNARDR